MDCDDEDNSGAPQTPGDENTRSAVNSLILDYYKKFGRKRDLEQYFSLSTAQSDIRDPSSSFWKSMKTEESSDSAERSDKKSDSSQELCRISIRCSVPDPSTSQEEDSKTKTESVSPPIIIEEVSHDSRPNSEDDAMKSDDNHSQKSFDVMLDTSTNKPLSPSSSITSQRKLEWDSLADVGYANESDRKTSASSLSTLERLALKQQYSNNDTQQSNLGPPTAHSTPLEDETRSRKKVPAKKSTKIHKKDTDYLEVNVPHTSSSNLSPSINVNLTKHISFNVEKDGKVKLGSVHKEVNVSPEKVQIEEISTDRMDKEIQTSLLRTKDSNTSSSKPENVAQSQKIPIMISLNTLRRTRRKRLRMARRKLKNKKKSHKENVSGHERSVVEQLSEAESFEYMPGHIYNQNQRTANEGLSANGAGNKSSLESSAALTTDSSKGSKHSFSKDLEKGIDILKNALHNRCDDAELKRKLIKQVCHRLLHSQYRDDDSTTDFLSGLSFSSKKLGLDHHTTTSTSDTNNSTEKSNRPKKSILRSDKFNPGAIASTSQSAPNLPVASKSDKLVTSNLTKTFTSSNTDSDMSSKDKTSSDNAGFKTPSEALYQKYLQALKREEAYKRHLKDKEMFLKQKLVSSDSAIKVPVRVEVKPNNRLKDLINDLTRNNYDDGSGDASKLEGVPGSSRDFDRFVPNRNQRSHSVFTLSSGNSDKKPNLKKRLQCEAKDFSKPGSSDNNHYCCCPLHSGIGKIAVADSSIQVNIKNPCTDENCPGSHKVSPRLGQIAAPICVVGETNSDRSGDIKYVCHCQSMNKPNDVSVIKCPNFSPDVQHPETSSENIVHPCNNQTCPSTSKGPCYDKLANVKSTVANPQIKRLAKSSQTNMLLKMLRRKSSDQSISSSIGKTSCQRCSDKISDSDGILSRRESLIYEATRCIQTEISIDPRIADPTLSDINIVNECECVKIISEHCRKSSKTSITDLYIPQIDAETCTIGDSIKSGTSNNRESEFLDDNKSQSNEICNKNIIENLNVNAHSKNKSGNFSIPIQGTNMTLLVSIGSERNEFMTKKTEGVGTDPIRVTEQATSLTEECSKEDQTRFDHNSNCVVNSSASEIKFGINPKTSICMEQNRLLRTLSIYDINRERSVQTEPCNKRDAATQENVPIQIQTSDCKIEKDFEDQKCSCGCFNSEETCKGKCKDQMDSNKSCAERRVSKDFQFNSRSPRSDKIVIAMVNANEICKCGCGGTKDKCLQDCSDRPGEECGKRALDKQISTHNLFNEQNEKCPCGCNGFKDNCQGDCAERTGTLGKPCENPSMDKQLGAHNILPGKPKEKCPCGCNGIKENCQENCAGHSGTQGKPCGNPSMDKQLGAYKLPGKPNEKCPCGCDGYKDNCQEECAGRTGTQGKPCKKPSLAKRLSTHDLIDTLNIKCPCGCDGIIDNCQENCAGRSGMPGEQCRKSSVKKSCTKKESLEQQTEKCLCGCAGNVDNCSEDCVGRNLIRSEPCTEKVFYSDIGEKCTCGCGGTKDNCQKNCIDIAPVGGCGKQYMLETHGVALDNRKQSLEKKSCGQGNAVDESSENFCRCGCGGSIDNCIKDCIERKSSLNEPKTPNLNMNRLLGTHEQVLNSKYEECACGCGNSKDSCKESCSYSKKTQKTFVSNCDKIDVGTQKDLTNIENLVQNVTKASLPSQMRRESILDEIKTPIKVDSRQKQTGDNKSSDKSKKSSEADKPDPGSDHILNLIKDITKRYSKKDTEKNKRKKCFTEIVLALNYLLETDDCNEGQGKLLQSSTTPDDSDNNKNIGKPYCQTSSNKLVDKGIQLPRKSSKTRTCVTQSFEVPTSTDIPATSSDSAACKVLHKIKKECEKYHQKRCKVHSGKKCDASSSTSVNCDQCRRVHHCACRSHKCKGHKKSTEKIQKGSIAYNLILQTSESVISEGKECEKNCQLKNIIVKVPKRKPTENIPFKEMASKFERNMSPCSPRIMKPCRSRSLPNESEISSMDEIIRKSRGCTVREYLEKNRPDFVERCSQRQNCLKYISESRAHDRAMQRDMLSMYMAQLPDVTTLDSDGLRELASDLGQFMRKKKPAPKFISEREMKKRSEKIYKSLPEVVQKKEEIKKENIKKTNLLMANIFKKNLQKKTLRGSVNLSNYSNVVKI